MQTGKQVLLAWLLTGATATQGQNLYVFSIIETKALHRPNRTTDSNRLQKLTDEVARYGNYTKHWYDLSDSTAFTPRAVRNTLNLFKPRSAEIDVVWLHYSGQGYSDGAKAWPTLQLNGGDVALRELLAILRDKPVRTLLVTVDCGNMLRTVASPPPYRNTLGGVKPPQKSSPVIVPKRTQPAYTDGLAIATADVYQQLFRADSIRQIIIMASAAHGQRAFRHATLGSVWLHALTTAITVTADEQPAVSTWKQVQEKIVQSTRQHTRNRQTPLFNRQTITCCETDISY